MGPTEIGLAALVTVPFVTRYVGKIGDSLAGNTLERVEKFWLVIRKKPAGILPILKSAETEASNVDFYQAAQELEVAANEDSEVTQAVIDVFEAAKQENPEYVKNLESDFEKIKSQGVTAEKINALFQETTISGGVSGNTGDIRGVFQHNTISGGVKI
ncbi:MAG: hypothetical protein F6K40_13955 [Okeania sp. SIO3I5]|uniref:hypothetical protein n=1 Tax=Okeania sp. SIO3I5 TaxID=2607805 RepID=UPI0013B9A386|nr:hypothetical protein [Okeania sp. SIO3I5]NEQ37310.1 hypothetical protein [Okeania sp. SIO3I5]